MRINLFDPNLSREDFFNTRFYYKLLNSKNFNNFKIFSNSNIDVSLKKKLKAKTLFNTEINLKVKKNYQKSYNNVKTIFEKNLNSLKNLNGPILLYNSTLPFIDMLVEWVIKKNYRYNIFLELPTLLGNYKNNKNLIFEKKRYNVIKSLLKNKKNIFFISHFKETSERLKKLLNPKIKYFNYPLDLRDYKIKKNNFKEDQIIKIGFLGQQRVNKGLKLLPKIIKNLSLYKNLKITVHDPYKNLSTDFKKKYLNLKIDTITYEYKDFINYLNSFDLIVLPYNPKRYKYSYSSIMIDSILLEKVVIGPNNTILSNMISSKNKNFFFDKWTHKCIVMKILELIPNYRIYKKKMRKERILFLKKINKKNFNFTNLNLYFGQ
jgi:hypothetical protein